MALGLLLFKAFYNRESRSVTYKIVPGARLRISGVDFSNSERTVLLAVSRSCRYCTESAPFYRRLDAAIKGSGIRTIALFPENETNQESYLKELGITPDEIHNLPLSAVGVTTIPAFVITDGAGSVIEIWNGKLPPRVQSLIFERLNLTDTRPTSEWLVQEDELPELLKRNGGAVVLDVRDRESFSKRHIPKAINIPLDELQVRASNELSTENLFVITARDDFQSDLAYKLLDTQGFSRLLILLPSASNQ